MHYIFACINVHAEPFDMHENQCTQILNLLSPMFCLSKVYLLFNRKKIKTKIIGISESRLQKNKQLIANIYLPNYVYENTPAESSKGGALLYLDKNHEYIQIKKGPEYLLNDMLD